MKLPVWLRYCLESTQCKLVSKYNSWFFPFWKPKWKLPESALWNVCLITVSSLGFQTFGWGNTPWGVKSGQRVGGRSLCSHIKLYFTSQCPEPVKRLWIMLWGHVCMDWIWPQMFMCYQLFSGLYTQYYSLDVSLQRVLHSLSRSARTKTWWEHGKVGCTMKGRKRGASGKESH